MALQSLWLIIALVNVCIFPQVSALSNDFAHIDLDLLQSVDVHLHSRSIYLVQIPENLLNGLI